MEVFRVKVTNVKASQYRKGCFYITTEHRTLGEIKVVGSKEYKIGEEILIHKRNPIDWIWDIVKTFSHAKVKRTLFGAANKLTAEIEIKDSIYTIAVSREYLPGEDILVTKFRNTYLEVIVL